MILIAGCLAVLPASAGQIDILASRETLALGPGKSLDITFKDNAPSRRLYLTFHARIASETKDFDGVHALRITLNDTVFTPENAPVLNKTEVATALPSKHRKESWPNASFRLFDLEKKSRLVMKDYECALTDVARLAPVIEDYYYGYVFSLKPEMLKPGQNTLQLDVLKTGEGVEISDLAVWRPTGNTECLLAASPWMKVIFPWQDFFPERSLSAPLKTRACADEREPVAFSVHALRELSDVTVECGDLRSDDGQSIPATNLDLFQFAAPERGARGGIITTKLMPFVPDEWVGLEPMLLKRLEAPVDISSGESQRFLLDIEIPEGQKPGKYTTSVLVKAGERALGNFPLELEVLPFQLAKPRQKYWMWRLQWTDVWREDNVACLRDIAEHGFNGLVQTQGFSFRVSAVDGKIKVDDSYFRKGVEVLDRVGLERNVREQSTDDYIFRTAIQIAGVEVPKDLHMAIGKIKQKEKGVGSHLCEAPEGPSRQMTPDPFFLTDAENALGENLPEIEALMLDAFRQIKKTVDELDVEFAVFPVDEPCGRWWRREYTKFISKLVHQAGLRTFSTQNAMDWPSGIDDRCMGSGNIPVYYQKPGIKRGEFTGDLSFKAIPHLGCFRDPGPRGRRPKSEPMAYMFKGLIDDVRIYNRALTDEEIEQQHVAPARRGLVAYYDFERLDGERAIDRSGNGMDLENRGAASRTGKIGKAVYFDGESAFLSAQETGKVDMSDGWSISFWMKGIGEPFGYGYSLYLEAGRTLFFQTTDKKYTPRMFTAPSEFYWSHVTISLDNKSKEWKALAYAKEKDDDVRKKATWTYHGMSAMWPSTMRLNTGLMAWNMSSGVKNITTFAYDWNMRLNGQLVWPDSGERFPGGDGRKPTTWYATHGWTAVREGIDDARYFNTLFLLLKDKLGSEDAANARIDELLPLTEVDWSKTDKVQDAGGCDALRDRVIAAILDLSR